MVVPNQGLGLGDFGKIWLEDVSNPVSRSYWRPAGYKSGLIIVQGSYLETEPLCGDSDVLQPREVTHFGDSMLGRFLTGRTGRVGTAKGVCWTWGADATSESRRLEGVCKSLKE